MEYGLMILNSLIEKSNGTFKIEMDCEFQGNPVISVHGFKYYFCNGRIDLESLVNANASLTAFIGVKEGWIAVPNNGDSK